MRVFSYPRLFGMLFLALVILLLINVGFAVGHVRWGRLTDAFLAGLLPACALLVALRQRPGWAAAAKFAALGMVCAVVAQLLSVLPIAFGVRGHLLELTLIAVLIYSLACASSFWALVRHFWFPSLSREDFAWTIALVFLAAAACRLMTQLAVQPLVYSVASLLCSYAWWFALAASLFYSEEKRTASLAHN